jgi:AmmeMemoRadiSam system protein B
VKKLIGIMLIVFVLSCNKNIPSDQSKLSDAVSVYHTWLSMEEREYGEPVNPPFIKASPHGCFPWAGIVSHHLLAHDYLDAWFSNLAQIRQCRRFYILSPSHYGISLETYSLTTGSWESGFGLVESDKEKVKRLSESLNVNLDPGVFQYEHGVSTLIPYIKKYFPLAVVVAIAYEASPPVNVPLSRRLADVLEKEFGEDGKQENFLLISADFSHHGSLEETYNRDKIALQYFEDSAGIPWNMVICDNGPGIYILNQLGKNNMERIILYHTNSWEISGEWEDDVTSYFFVLITDK